MGSDTGGRTALPTDIAVTLGLTLLAAGAVVVPVVNDSLLRVAVAVPFALFVPGWALVAALFPYAHRTDVEAATHGITVYERVALAFGTSIAVIPVVGLVLSLTPFGLALAPTVVALAGVVCALAAIAVYRRRQLPADLRFAPAYGEWLAAVRRDFFGTETTSDTLLTGLMVLSLVLAAGGVGYVSLEPKQGADFTEFYVLSPNGTGEPVAGEYPDELTVGQPQPLIVGVENNEHRTETYSVVVERQRVSVHENETRVRESDRLHRFETTLADNGTWQRPHNVTSATAEGPVRVVYLLYTDGVPEDPSVDNAYRDLRLSFNVTDG